MKSKAKALYIHIPFCRNICTYCDFKKFIYNQKRIDEYFKSLFFELKNFDDEKYTSIYIGGGTPSCIDKQNLEQFLRIVSKKLAKNYKEFCIESNVEDLNENLLELLCKYGINRLSIGVQTFNEKFIKFCNRRHTKELAIKNITLASKYIKNISIDLIFAFPGQTIRDIKKDIEIACSLPIKHLSYYSLLVEENTILWARKIKNVDDITQAKMYTYICKKLKKYGIHRYEISNFAKYKKYESYHNKVYWQNKHYDAAGLAASGYIDNLRYVNNCNILEYNKFNYKHDNETYLNKEDIMFDQIMLNLRMDEGLDIKKFNKRFKVDFLNKYKDALNENFKNKTLIIKKGKLKTTFKGSLLLNSVLEYFLD